MMSSPKSGTSLLYIRTVITAYILGYLPHMTHLPLPVTLWCAFFWTWEWFGCTRSWPMPSSSARNALTLLGLALAIGAGLLQNSTFDMLTGISMLAILLGLKPLEVDSRETGLSALCLSLFLGVFGVFHSESIMTGAYILAVLIIILSLTIRINAPGHAWRKNLFMALRLTLYGLPLAVALFLACPRLPFGLFGMDKSTSTTGLQDTLQMGDLGLLASNQDIVFRAKFNNQPPPPRQMYWRGLVLWDFDGRTWSRPEDLPQGPNQLVGHTPVSYELHLEPSTNHWLYSLDMPFSPVAGAEFFLDNTFLSRFSLKSGRRLRLHSFLSYNTGNLQPWERWRSEQLPPQGNPRARALARRWAQESGSSEEVLSKALHFFEQRKFSYTFNPPMLPETDFIDAFLFDTKSGYCSHFAAAMAFLLRAAGVPARIVVGYLGAENNPIGDYLIVRQAYAHAWDELWIPHKGWVRVDPTTTVSPERMELGPLLYQFEGQTGAANQQETGLRTMLHTWDALSFYWERSVLSYSYFRQRSLLSKLGIRMRGLTGILQTLGLMLAVVLLGSAATYALWRLRAGFRTETTDPALRSYQRFCHKLAKAGLQPKPGTGPMDFADQLRTQRPELAEAITRITNCYIRLRYGPPLSPQERKHLEHQLRAEVRNFSP